ncbi:uroporphyrinogen-III synthase [Litorihabitans aurantiacus]|uniref:uroporphyrinogen-III synthase n=1 Tax=Litorihabitans aurantiacus TaxID=1930061 RepID=UPI0024E0998E|nr:uroporphyrinogen-III synthase [Litorihabitans aurantiacus]
MREALSDLDGGRFGWLVLTSVNAVAALTDRGAEPGATRVAAVGEETARAARRAGWDVALVPDRHDATGLVAAFAALPTGAAAGTPVLLPLSARAADTVADGLVNLGLAPVRVDAYDLADVDPDPVVVAALARGEVDAVLVTSGSIARRVAAVFAPLPAGLAVACIGEPSARAAREAGLAVAVVATRATGAGTVAALAAHLAPLATSITTTHDHRERPT